MASRYVLFTDVKDEDLDDTPIQDGQVIISYPSGQFFLDEGTTRYEVGGKIADTALSKTSTNPLQNQAITNNIVNSLDDAKAVTKDNVFASTKVIKELAANSANIEDVTQDEYDALTDEQKNDGTIRNITDAEEDYQSAGGVKYINTSSELSATNVQDAIDELKTNIGNETLETTAQNCIGGINELKEKLTSEQTYFNYSSNGANYIRTNDSAVKVTNTASNAYKPIAVSDVLINGATSLGSLVGTKGDVTFLGNITASGGSLTIDLTSYKELCIVLYYYSSSRRSIITIPKGLLSSSSQTFTDNVFYNTSNYIWTEYYCTLTSVKLNGISNAGAFDFGYLALYGIK